MSSSPSLRLLRASILGLVILAGMYALRIGPSTTNATYSSWPAVFQDVVGGPAFLVVVALAAAIAGMPLVVAMRERWPAHLRTRATVRRWIASEILWRPVAVAAVVAVCILVCGLVVFGLVAPRSSGLVDPSGYGEPDEVARMVDGSYPLYAAAGRSSVGFVVLSALWAGLHAGLISLMSALAALLIRNRVLALLAPAVLLIGASIGLELTVGPAASPLITWVHPGGLLPSNLIAAAIPGLLLGLVCGAMAVVLLRRAPQMDRFS